MFHEVPLRFNTDSGARVEGTIDLLWKDEAGWHILDYKAGSDYPHGTGDEPLSQSKLQEYFAQTQLYAQCAAPQLDAPLVDFGLWYVAAGLVVRWDEKDGYGAVEPG